MKFIKDIIFNYNWTQAEKALYKGDMNKYNKYQRKVYHSIWSKYTESE